VAAADPRPADARRAELRRWFGHDPKLWPEFQQRYRDELADKVEVVDRLTTLVDKGRVTLLYGASDHDHDNAVVLRDVLEDRRNRH
jgi:uncharacterized protein YeaO (DUF488 family)